MLGILHNNAMPEAIAYFGLITMNQAAKERITKKRRMGKASPRKDIIHQLRGSRWGARHDKRKKITRIILQNRKNRLVKSRHLPAIGRIYEIGEEQGVTGLLHWHDGEYLFLLQKVYRNLPG